MKDFMRLTIRPIAGAICWIALTMFQPANASVTTVNCTTAVHIADFANCAKTKSVKLGGGIYVPFSLKNFTTVKIVGTWQPGFCGSCPYIFVASSVTTFKENGAPATLDADLNLADQTIITAVAANLPALTIDPSQVYSLVGVEFPEVLTRQINGDLLSILGPLYNNLPLGTRVMVTCTGDGTNAQFQKISFGASVMWEMVPNTLKNKAGQFIDSSGKVIGPPINHLNLTNLVPSFPSFPGNGLSPVDWTYWSPDLGVSITIGNLCVNPGDC